MKFHEELFQRVAVGNRRITGTLGANEGLAVVVAFRVLNDYVGKGDHPDGVQKRRKPWRILLALELNNNRIVFQHG